MLKTQRSIFTEAIWKRSKKSITIKKEEIISLFRQCANPLGISSRLRSSLSEHLDAITTYPDREYRELRQCIADYAGSQPENIIVGNGSTELISLFIQTYRPKKSPDSGAHLFGI